MSNVFGRPREAARALRRAALEVSGATEPELGLALGLFFYNFLIITSYLIIKPVRNSLFLDYLGAANLPWAYIGTTLFVGGAVVAYNRLVDRLGRTQVIVTTWCLLGAGLVAFWFALSTRGVVASALFYFFSAVYSVMGVTQFWSFSAEVLDARQARRLYGFLGAGGILGGLVGGATTGVLAQGLGTEQLLFLSAVLCLGCAVLGGLLSARSAAAGPAAEETPARRARLAPEEEAPPVTDPAAWRTILDSRYLLLICGLIFSLQMVSTLVDFQFNHVVADAFPHKDARTAFFGTFFVCLNITSLSVQFFLTRWIHRSFGLGPALLVLPSVMLFTGAGFVLWPVFLMGCVLKISSGSLDYSIDRASRELLYLPTPREVKYKAKAFVDMFCFRLFRCLAGLLILAFGALEGVPLEALSVVVMAVAVFWIGTARAARREYVRQVRLRLGGTLEAPACAPVPAHARDGALVDLGYEAARYVRSLRAAGRARADWGDTWGRMLARSEARLLELCGALYGEFDLALVREALADPERRALGLELLEGVSDPRVGRRMARILDPERPLEERLENGARLLDALGDLPRRSQPRLVWTAPPPLPG